MGCNSDYMNATEREVNLSIVYGLLDELETGKLPDNFGSGYDKRVYSKHLSKQHLDEKTAELCSKLKRTDVTKYSLELQMWWRDHQKADMEREKKKLEIDFHYLNINIDFICHITGHDKDTIKQMYQDYNKFK